MAFSALSVLPADKGFWCKEDVAAVLQEGLLAKAPQAGAAPEPVYTAVPQDNEHCNALPLARAQGMETAFVPVVRSVCQLAPPGLFLSRAPPRTYPLNHGWKSWSCCPL